MTTRSKEEVAEALARVNDHFYRILGITPFGLTEKDGVIKLFMSIPMFNIYEERDVDSLFKNEIGGGGS